jgi:N6-adenosine-specific RNA methylase IME4
MPLAGFTVEEIQLSLRDVLGVGTGVEAYRDGLFLPDKTITIEPGNRLELIKSWGFKAATGGRFGVVTADPAWHYNQRAVHSKFGGGPPYPLMPDKEILELGKWLDPLVADNAVLFLWATGARLDFALDVIREWGWRYATTAFVWTKQNKNGTIFGGPGSYTASNAEFVLLGVRGSMRPERKMLNQVVITPRMPHSVKPEEVADRIELMYPQERKLELFARRRRPGWACLGNEITGHDIRVDLEVLARRIAK